MLAENHEASLALGMHAKIFYATQGILLYKIK